MPARRRCTLFALLSAAAAWPLAAHAAAQPDYMPPPGLYRIDDLTEGSGSVGGVKSRARSQVDGATGDQQVSGQVDGAAGIDRGLKGGGPNTHCVRPVSSAAPALPAFAAMASCTTKGGVVENGAFVIRQNCANDQRETRIRKLARDSWEYQTVLTQNGNSSATRQSTEGAVLAMLREQRAQARTDAERKGLDDALAQFASLSKEEKAHPNMALAHPARSTGVKSRMVMTQTWTRIAEKCDAPKK